MDKKVTSEFEEIILESAIQNLRSLKLNNSIDSKSLISLHIVLNKLDSLMDSMSEMAEFVDFLTDY